MSNLRAKEIYKDVSRTIFTVESVEIQHSTTKTGGHLIGNIKPIAVIVRSPEGIYALDMEANPANMDQLRQELPELDFLK
jgi:uncharacterized spore protein YtfJ